LGFFVVWADGVGSPELLGFSPVSPKISGGSDSSTVIPVLASLAPRPEPNSGISLSVVGLETNLVSGVSPVHVEDALGVGAGFFFGCFRVFPLYFSVGFWPFT
jgi:hypothetical protein